MPMASSIRHCAAGCAQHAIFSCAMPRTLLSWCVQTSFRCILPGLSSEAVLDQAGTELAEEGNTTLVLVLKSLASRDAGPIAPLQGTWTACKRVKLMACTSLQCALGRLGA